MNPIKIDPEIMSGTPCFAGTRVPVKALFDILEGGQTIDNFLEGFPTVTREQVVAVLELAANHVAPPTSRGRVKVLLDECVHVGLRNYITGHDVFTVKYIGWAGVKNGELLAQAVANGFEAFVTTDRGIRDQQRVATLPIAIYLLLAQSNRLADLQASVPPLLAALNHAQPRTVTEIRP